MADWVGEIIKIQKNTYPYQQEGKQQETSRKLWPTIEKYDLMVRSVLKEFSWLMGMKNHMVVGTDNGSWVLVLEGGTRLADYYEVSLVFSEVSFPTPVHFLVEWNSWQRIVSNTGPIGAFSLSEAEEALKNTLVEAYRIGFL